MKKNIILIHTFILVTFFQLKAKDIVKEVFISKTSLTFLVQNDTIIDTKYKKVFEVYRNKNYIKALKEALSLYDETKENGNTNLHFKITLLVADIYDKTNKYSISLTYYKTALENLKGREQLENNRRLFDSDYAKTLLRVGSTFQKLQKNDSAKFYYKELEKFASLDKEILGIKAISFGNLSGIYERDSLFNKAKEYATKAVQIHKKRKDKADEASAINNLGNIYLSLGDFEKAKDTYIDGIELIENDKSAIAIRYKANLYSNLAWAMRNLKDYKTYDFQELSYEIEDGIRDKEIRRIIETVTAQNNVKNVKREEENKRLKDQRTFWIIGVGTLIVIISLLYWVNFYKLKKNNLALKLTQTQLIQSQKIEKIRSDSQTRILNATIDGKESERKQIAETLHDSVSALLSSANLHLQATKSQFNGNAPVEIDKTGKIIAEASQKIRDLSHTLVSSVLLKFGLEFAIKDMADKYSNSQIEFTTSIGDIRRYHQSFEIKAYNIIQEFANNILKHSKAKNAKIELKEQNNKLYLRIADDGIGFDKTKVTDKDGLGLNQIYARIQIMKGHFFIDSALNKGTIIDVELPILEKETTLA